MSNLKIPNFQLWLVVVFAIFKETARALARVSTFFVEDVTVNGPSDELAGLSLGNLLVVT